MTTPNKLQKNFHSAQCISESLRVWGGSLYMRVCNITFIMMFLPKYGTYLVVVYFVSATQATIVQIDTEVNTESYFEKMQTGRQIIGAAGEEIKVQSNMECSHG